MPTKTQYVLKSWSATTFACITLFLLSLNSLAQSGMPRDDMVYTVVEKQPEFPGGLQTMWDYLQANANYPDAAQKAGVKGLVFLSFIVWKDSRISDVTVLKGLGSGCDEEAVRVIKAMPRWAPGSQDGKPLNVKYNLPVSFGVPYPTIDNITEKSQPAPKLEHLFGGHDETQPEFPGGSKALMRYIQDNVRYPEAARQAGITGRVFTSFIIDTAGYISQIQVLKEIGYGCDEEAVRLINGLPRWKPGTMSGRGVVAVKYNLPIDFPPKQPDPLREN